MSTVGIIAEYNPFHNGHKYQIDKVKQLTGCDNVVVILSGNYIQRGVPSAYPKYHRAKMCVENGASMVIEMPVIASTASAELFAHCGVSILNQLGFIDYLCFGAETDDLKLLDSIADYLSDEPTCFKNELTHQLGLGLSFPIARSNALIKCLKDDKKSNHSYSEEIIYSTIYTPNNILAIEYLKALKILNSNIKPIIIKRNDYGYSSTSFNGIYGSATAIRHRIETDLINEVQDLLPETVYNYVDNNRKTIIPDMMSDILYYKLINTSNYTQYFDVSLDLSNRINNLKYNFTCYSNFIQTLHSKNNTDTHIQRALLHILLEIPNNAAQLIKNKENYYINILAINKSNLCLLNEIKNNSCLPIINKFGVFYNSLDENSTIRKILDINIKADNIYNYLALKYTNQQLLDDFHMQFKNKLI